MNYNKIDDDEDTCENALIKNNSEDDVQSDDGIKAIAEPSDEETNFQNSETNPLHQITYSNSLC